MLSILLGWIPVVGPIIQGLTSIFTGYFNKEVSMRQADVDEAKVSAQIIHDTNDDIGLRLLRDLYCSPAVVHLFLVSWDTIIAKSTWVNHKWMWHVEAFPPSYAWYPTTVAVFLLGNIGLNIWKRK